MKLDMALVEILQVLIFFFSSSPPNSLFISIIYITPVHPSSLTLCNKDIFLFYGQYSVKFTVEHPCHSLILCDQTFANQYSTFLTLKFNR